MKKIKIIFPGQIRELQTDNGGELCNKISESFLKRVGINYRKSIPYEHEMQGRAKNNNRIILEGICVNLFGAQISNGYWTYAGHASVMFFIVWNDQKTNEVLGNSLRTFGVLDFSHISREKIKKLEPSSVKVRLLGYASDSKDYVVRDLEIETSRIFNSRSFFYDE